MGLAAQTSRSDGSEDRITLAPPFRMQGHCWVASLAELPMAAALAAIADSDDFPRRSTIRLLENGRPLGPSHAAHTQIREKGKGAFSHWKDALYFSTNDGSDPNRNGRVYELVIRYAAHLQSDMAPAIRRIAPSAGAEIKTSGASLAAARSHVQQRQWAQAIAILENLAAFPELLAEAQAMLARAYFETGRLQEADRVFSDLVTVHPDDGLSWLALGRIRKKLKDWPRARDAWKRVVDLRPNDVEGHWELAQASWDGGFRDQARVEVEWILARDADHRGALTVLARALSDSEPERSLACWSRLATSMPQAFEPHLQVARLHLRARRETEAEQAYRTVLALVPAHPEALAKLSLIVGSRNEEEAVELLSRWSAAAPTDVAPWIAFGELYASMGKLEQAEVAFRRGLEVAPRNVQALTHLARTLRNAAKYDDALEAWRDLADLAPQSVEPRLQIARIFQMRRNPHTEEALRLVLAVDPAHLEALQSLAQHLERDEARLADALEMWARLADANTASVQPLIERGRLLERHDRLVEAEADYRSAIARAPADAAALDTLTDFYSRHQRWEEAIEAFQKHLDRAPRKFAAMLGLSACLERVGRMGDAETLYDRALALEPANLDDRLGRARLLRSLGRLDAAATDYREACSLDPTNTEAWRNVVVLLARLEREDEARTELDRAEACLGSTSDALVVLGHTAEAAQFDERAVAYFKQAIDADGQTPMGHAALGLHYFRRGIVDGAFHHLLDSRDRDPSDTEVARALFDITSMLRSLNCDPMDLRSRPRTLNEILVPERLFDLVVRAASDGSVAPYQPEPRRVITVTSSLAAGGAERQLALMMQGLSDPRFELQLSLFAVNLSHRMRRDFFLPLLADSGVEVVECDEQTDRKCLQDTEVVRFADIVRNFPNDMVGPIAFWLREFRRRRPAVVHAWQDLTSLSAVVAALLAGVPKIILCCRSVRPDNPRRRLRRFMKEAYQAVLRHPSVVLTNNSRAGADDYAAWLGIDPARIDVVYNGIDFDHLERSAAADETARARRELGMPEDVPVLGGVFRMSEEKRPILWLEAAAEVARQKPGVHFVICGDGPMREEAASRAKVLGIANVVHMPGAQYNIASWYKMMDVVMLASRHEGLPNVLLEAQSLGVPVVAPDVGGMSEVVEQGVTGWTVRDADAKALADRVLVCLNDERFRHIAVKRGPDFVRGRFGIEAMLRKNLELYGVSVPQASN